MERLYKKTFKIKFHNITGRQKNKSKDLDLNDMNFE